MTKMLLFVSGAIVIGFALQSCSSTHREPEIDATHRVANCTVLLVIVHTSASSLGVGLFVA